MNTTATNAVTILNTWYWAAASRISALPATPPRFAG
jgi:hypothetical protein